MARFETQVGIIGAGPAGLMLSHLLHLNGIGSIVLEARSRAYCEERVRAGVLEHTSVEMLRETGVAERLDRLGLRHEGIELGLDGLRHRIPFVELTGKQVTVYGQQEVVKDLIARRLADGGDLRFECGDVSLHEIDSNKPWIRVEKDGATDQILCDYIAGCDGFHGISRTSIPEEALTAYECAFPFAWLGILAEAAPSRDELLYMHHEPRFRALQHAFAAHHAALSAVSARRRHRRMERRSHLERAAHAPGLLRRLASNRGKDPPEGRDRNAQLCRGAAAVWPALFWPAMRRTSCPHRRQGNEPRVRRCVLPGESVGRMVSMHRRSPAPGLFRNLSAPNLEGPALLGLDDLATPPL